MIEPGIAQVLKVGEERIRLALERLALAVHERQRPEHGEPGDVPQAEVVVAFESILGTLSPSVLLSYLNDRAGLLLPRREGVYAFPHRSFQEYLAACRLSNLPDFIDAMRERLARDPEWWREVWLFAVGRAKRGGLSGVVMLMNALLEAPTEPPDRTDLHWRLASLVGQALIASRIDVKGGGSTGEALIRRCRTGLVQLVEEGGLSAHERAEAGDVLGRLGDPRFDGETPAELLQG